MSSSEARICIFLGSLRGGGAERVAAKLANHLVEEGHPVCLITLFEADIDFYTLDSRVERSVLGLTGENKGVRKLTATYERVSALRKAVRRFGTTTLISFMTQESVLAILATWGLGINTVVSERNYPAIEPIEKKWGILRKLFYRFADSHVCQTERTREWLTKNTSAKGCIIIPNPVNIPLPLNEPKKLPDTFVFGQPFILAVGSNPYVKGFDRLLGTFVEIEAEIPDFNLVFVGIDEGLYTSSTKEFLKQLELLAPSVRSRVHNVGRCGNMHDWYQAADIFVLSSRYEGMPNVLLEAMAYGTAAIALDIDTGPSDIISNPRYGLLTAEKDQAQLGQNILFLAANKQRRDEISKAGALHIANTYSDKVVFSKWGSLIC